MVICDSVLLLSMFSRFIHIVACQYFITLYGRMIVHYIDISHFVYSLADGHLGCLYFLSIIICFEHLCRIFLFEHAKISFFLDIYLGVKPCHFWLILLQSSSKMQWNSIELMEDILTLVQVGSSSQKISHS